MTNEEIIIKHRGCDLGCYDEQVARIPIYHMLDLARSDEREKLKDQIPKEGTLEWAAQQRRQGKKPAWRDTTDGFVWNDEWSQGDEAAGLDKYLDGWSVVPDEPKPERIVFSEFDSLMHDGKPYTFRDGQWFPC